MKVLLLHPGEEFQPRPRGMQWDLVVDLGRVPIPICNAWGRSVGCPIISIYNFAEGVADLRRTRRLIQHGMNSLVSHQSIDWWSVLSPEILPELQQLILIHRLAEYIGRECDIYSSRSDYRSNALHRLLGGRLIIWQGALQSGLRQVRRHSGFISKFDFGEMFQIVQDKFDREHAIRRRFAKRAATSSQPLILLPSAYINVSRTALSYATLLPHEEFLLACTRDVAKVQHLPRNVRMISLDSYFSSPDSQELPALLERWEKAKIRLIDAAPEYESAAAVGVFDRMPSLIRWGIIVRDAWRKLFESENFRACFCADHSNPYTRIPLLLAKHDGIPAVVCHHGALDAGMAMTTHDADFYIAKSEMEHDYMRRVCGIDPAKMLDVARPSSIEAKSQLTNPQSKAWLVFFSEPYQLWSWRQDEVYGELLPQLYLLAAECGVKLVFKLHPFESVKGHRKLLLRHLPAEKVRKIGILAGPISEQLWENTRFALTAQSSVALECDARGIPIFLCGWLKDSFSGYVQQYQRFGVGHLLESASEIADIPHLLKLEDSHRGPKRNVPDSAGVDAFKELLTASHSLSTAAQS